MSLFDKYGFNKDLLESIKKLKFIEPTPIQDKVIPEILSSEVDIIATAQTGTGKTAAFGLPIINLTNNREKTIECVILCPTRELCLQITKDLNVYSENIKHFRIVAIYGGSRVDTQIKGLKQNPKIIVCTPGRLNDLIKRRRVDLGHIKYFVLDEADEMLSMGFKSEIDIILEHVPQNRKIYLFSATLSKKVTAITKTYMKNALTISTSVANKGADTVKHIYYVTKQSDRYDIIRNIIDVNKDIYTIIFCRTRRETKDISNNLIQNNYKASVLNGDLSQEERDRVMNKFRTQQIKILVATDVASRGIDVNNLSHIINYNLPDDPEVYVHRSGRTGRAGNEGISIALVSKREQRRLKEIERLSKISFTRNNPPTDTEVFETQIHTFASTIIDAPLPNEEDKQTFNLLYSKLNTLTKDEIIGKIISLNINRTKKHKKDIHKSKSDNIDKSDSLLTKLSINVGRSHKMNPESLIRLIKKTIRLRNAKIGKISVKKSFSLFEIETKIKDDIISKMNQIRHDRQKISVSVYKGEEMSSRPIRPKRNKKFIKKRRRK